MVRKKEVEDTLRQEFEQSLPEKVRRLSELNTPWLIPYHHFASASAECILLFRDGHFHGCISLVQAVTEALTRFLCEKNRFRPKKNFEENIEKLLQRGFITPQQNDYFLKIWRKRHDYHHLNKSILKDRQALEVLAKKYLNLQHKIQREIFHFDIREGKIMPRHVKYWDTVDRNVSIQGMLTVRRVFKKPTA